MMDPFDAIVFHRRASDYHCMQETMWDAAGEGDAMIEGMKYQREQQNRHDAELERLKADWPEEYERALEYVQQVYESEG